MGWGAAVVSHGSERHGFGRGQAFGVIVEARGVSHVVKLAPDIVACAEHWFEQLAELLALQCARAQPSRVEFGELGPELLEQVGVGAPRSRT